MARIPVALQLYTVRDYTAKDFSGTVKKVAEMGYDGVEFAGMDGLSAEEMKDLLSETGLQPAGSHIALNAFQTELDAVLAYNEVIGNKYLGVPALPNELRNPRGFHEAARLMNEIGARVQEAGFVLYYHNHAFEFEVMDGERGIDILYGETDPELVKLECDVYWVAKGGESPAEFIRAHAGRFPLIHLKDMTSDAEATFAEVGEGRIDFEPIFEASEEQGAEWYIVEQDRSRGDTLESARTSADNLKKWGKL